VTGPRTRVSNGESSIFLGADDRWHGYVTMGYRTDGRIDRRHREGKTRKDVARKVAELERARDSGQFASAGSATTLEQWLTYWLREVAPGRLRRKALASYRTDVVKHLIPGLGKVRLKRLTWIQIEAFESDMRREVSMDKAGVARVRYRPATIDHVHRTLRSAMNDAVRAGLMAVNPAAQVRRGVNQSLESADFEGEVLTVDEARRVIATALQREAGVRHILRLALGLRQGESLGLPWDRVHLDTDPPRLVVAQQLQRHSYMHGCGSETGPAGSEQWPCGARRGADCPARHSGGLVLTQVKTRRGERIVPLDEASAFHLRTHRAAQAEQRLAAGPTWRGTGLVFTQPDGGPIDPRADLREWKEILVDAGVRDVRLHDARHTAATVLLVQGVDKRVVMDLMGWSSEAMLRRYQHVVDELRIDAVRRATTYLYGTTDHPVHTAGT
jgi:integrase